mmetsp:Transcript_8722/g.12622  ORF Transcript_8722/g.12622 Transcript_8722/m.12622 type:complete len:102 (+) Transcript_8722:273-578(+)
MLQQRFLFHESAQEIYTHTQNIIKNTNICFIEWPNEVGPGDVVVVVVAAERRLAVAPGVVVLGAAVALAADMLLVVVVAAAVVLQHVVGLERIVAPAAAAP